MPVNIVTGGSTQTSQIVTNTISNGISSTEAYSTFLRRDGLNNMEGNLDMTSHTLLHVATPNNGDEVATKDYVDKIIDYSNILKLVPRSTLTCYGEKKQILPTSIGSNIGFFVYENTVNDGGTHVLNKLWLALNGTSIDGKSVSGNVFLKIHIDGALQVGTNYTSTNNTGMNTIALACDFLFAPLGGPFYANSLQGCNVHTLTDLGGYFTLDMPYKKSIVIELYNNTLHDVDYWIQPFVSKYPPIYPSTNPLNLSMYPSLPPYISNTNLHSLHYI